MNLIRKYNPVWAKRKLPNPSEFAGSGSMNSAVPRLGGLSTSENVERIKRSRSASSGFGTNVDPRAFPTFGAI